MEIPKWISAKSARLAVLVVALLNWVGTALWVGLGRGGFGQRREQLFNWHPVLASCAMLVLFPNGFLAWRNFTDLKRSRTKLFHATMMTSAFVLLNLAVGLAYLSKKQQNFSHFYSLHSWVGMMAIGSMKGNVIGGLLSTYSSYVREMKLAGVVHRLSGILACSLGFAAMLLGFAKEQGSVVRKSQRPLGALAISGGALGMLSLLVGVVVIGLVLAERNVNRSGVVAKDVDEETPETVVKESSKNVA